MPGAPFDERLDALLRVAAEVFARKGYHATTMRDLSRASGMSLAGMYHYVPGKEDLLYLIQQRCFQSVLAGVQDAIEKESDPVARLRTFVRRHLEFFAANMNEMKVLSHEAESLTGDRAREILELKRRYAQLLQHTIAGADGRHPSIAAYALFGMMNWIYTWYRPDGLLGPTELADTMADLFLHGVRGGSARARTAR
jgi:TetR/AcrR family transcriptional regulator, cholesterol catabolism regulator